MKLKRNEAKEKKKERKKEKQTQTNKELMIEAKKY